MTQFDLSESYDAIIERDRNIFSRNNDPIAHCSAPAFYKAATSLPLNLASEFSYVSILTSGFVQKNITL